MSIFKKSPPNINIIIEKGDIKGLYKALCHKDEKIIKEVLDAITKIKVLTIEEIVCKLWKYYRKMKYHEKGVVEALLKFPDQSWDYVISIGGEGLVMISSIMM